MRERRGKLQFVESPARQRPIFSGTRAIHGTWLEVTRASKAVRAVLPRPPSQSPHGVGARQPMSGQSRTSLCQCHGLPLRFWYHPAPPCANLPAAPFAPHFISFYFHLPMPRCQPLGPPGGEKKGVGGGLSTRAGPAGGHSFGRARYVPAARCAAIRHYSQSTKLIGRLAALLTATPSGRRIGPP